MQITRTEQATGGPNRTKREEMAPLLDGVRGCEPEQYPDCSPSEAWPWTTKPGVCTWTIQLASMKAFTEPFAALDTEAANETDAGGVATYPFSNIYLPLSDKRDEDGDLIIDVNPTNFDERMAYFMRLHSRYFENGLPAYGGTEVMEAIRAGDEHFMGELGKKPRSQRAVRSRVFWSDGLLNDAEAFLAYLGQAKAVDDPKASTVTPIGQHLEWDEVIAVALFGEEGGDGHKAYEQYAKFAKAHPWVHAYYFEGVTNGLEVAEDMALVTVPTLA